MDDRFDASRETARVYMRISREWDNPRLQEARHNGFELTSIQSVLRLLGGEKPSDEVAPNGDKPTEAELSSMARDNLRKQFAERLRTLTNDEIRVFEKCGVFDDVCDEGYARLKRLVCIVLDCDYYERRDSPRRGKDRSGRATQGGRVER